MNAPRSNPTSVLNGSLIPFVPPSWTVLVPEEKEEEEEEEEEAADAWLRLGKKELIPPLERSVMVWHSGPPSITCSTLSTGPSFVWTMVLLVLLVQLTVLEDTWLVLGWLWASNPPPPPPPPPNKSLLPCPPISVMDLDDVEEEEEAAAAAAAAEEDDDDVDGE